MFRERLLRDSEWPVIGMVLKVESYDEYTDIESVFVGRCYTWAYI